MNATRVVNLRHEPYDIYIGRAGHGKDGYFGNPFPLDPKRSRAEQISDVLGRYRVWFLARVETDPEFRARVLALRGKTLGCFCIRRDGSGDCHGRIIANWVDSQ